MTWRTILLGSAIYLGVSTVSGLLIARWMGACIREGEKREAWAEEQQHRY